MSSTDGRRPNLRAVPTNGQADPDTNNSETSQTPPPPSQGGQKSAATELVELARATYRFGTSTTGETFGIPIDGPPVTFMLRGGRQSLRAERRHDGTDHAIHGQ